MEEKTFESHEVEMAGTAKDDGEFLFFLNFPHLCHWFVLVLTKSQVSCFDPSSD